MEYINRLENDIGIAKKKEDWEIEASVIIPVYNTGKYIERAVKSVLKQTFQKCEIILIDDGSTDESWEVCMTMTNLNERVYAYHQNNTGVSSARNLGLRKARGTYIFFLDSDDEWKIELLEQVIDCFNRTNCDCVRFQAVSTNNNIFSYKIPEDKEKIYLQRDFMVKAMSDEDYSLNISSACWGAYKYSIIKKQNFYFDEKLAQGEDGVFVLDYLLECKEIAYLNAEIYIYHVFDPEERLSATGRGEKVLYDAYELRYLLYDKLYQKYRNIFTYTEKEVVYSFFYDRMIATLVRFAAYSRHLKLQEKIKMVKTLLTSELMEEAADYYTPRRKSDSKLIPYFMKHKWTIPLWIILYGKSKKYYDVNGRKKYAVSIYKENKLVEYWKK